MHILSKCFVFVYLAIYCHGYTGFHGNPPPFKFQKKKRVRKHSKKSKKTLLKRKKGERVACLSSFYV